MGRVSVATSDLDLSRRADARELVKRIATASQKACMAGYGHLRLYLANAPHFEKCVHSAMDTAVSRVGSPLVTAEYQGGAGLFASAGPKP